MDRKNDTNKAYKDGIKPGMECWELLNGVLVRFISPARYYVILPEFLSVHPSISTS